MEKTSYGKRETQARTTHKKIITAAAELFTRQGYHKTTISDIAQAVGLTSGAVFHHFSSKEELLEAVVNWLGKGMNTYCRYLERADKGSLELTRDLFGIMCNHFHRQPEATICLAALATEFAGSGHPMETRVKEVYENFISAFARILGDHPRVSDPRAAAMALIGAVQGIAVQGLLRRGEKSIDELAAAFVSLLEKW